MRRLFTVLLVAVLTLPSVALMSASARASCCCKTSGSCPLRKHAGCEKTCSMSGTDAAPSSAFRAPELARDPAVFLAASSGFAPTSTELVTTFSAAPLHRTTSPDLPPPRS